jgi:hypothetical protein
MTNVDKLANAGVLDPNSLTPAQRQFINNNLTDAEVNALISIRSKAGQPPATNTGDPVQIIFAF